MRAQSGLERYAALAAGRDATGDAVLLGYEQALRRLDEMDAARAGGTLPEGVDAALHARLCRQRVLAQQAPALFGDWERERGIGGRWLPAVDWLVWGGGRFGLRFGLPHLWLAHQVCGKDVGVALRGMEARRDAQGWWRRDYGEFMGGGWDAGSWARRVDVGGGGSKVGGEGDACVRMGGGLQAEALKRCVLDMLWTLVCGRHPGLDRGGVLAWLQGMPAGALRGSGAAAELAECARFLDQVCVHLDENYPLALELELEGLDAPGLAALGAACFDRQWVSLWVQAQQEWGVAQPEQAAWDRLREHMHGGSLSRVLEASGQQRM